MNIISRVEMSAQFQKNKGEGLLLCLMRMFY